MTIHVEDNAFWDTSLPAEAEPFGSSDFPEDCHNHCRHYNEGERCCDCGEQLDPEPILDAIW